MRTQHLDCWKSLQTDHSGHQIRQAPSIWVVEGTGTLIKPAGPLYIDSFFTFLILNYIRGQSKTGLNFSARTPETHLKEPLPDIRYDKPHQFKCPGEPVYSIIGLYRFLAPVLALYFIKTPVGTAKPDENDASGLLKVTSNGPFRTSDTTSPIHLSSRGNWNTN